MPRLTLPDNQRPWLLSEGFDGKKWTRHKFVGYETFTIKYPTTEKKVSGMVFECEETGARRRYGFQG